MRLTRDEALRDLSDLLAEVRARAGLAERSTAVFYRHRRAFLHFHLEPPGMIAHLKEARAWRKLPVNTAAEQKRFLAALDSAMNAIEAK